MSVVLHIGLHKTATTYLQQAVFNRIADPGLVVDPMPLSRYLGPLFFRLDYGLLREHEVREFAKRLHAARRAHADRRWLISNETLGQNMYLLNYRAHAELLGRLFPEAQIVLMLRFQPDWFLSAYKQLVSRGDVQSIEDFLGYRDGTFHRCHYLDLDGRILAHTNALELHYHDMIETLRQIFGTERVHVFFYEHFREHTDEVLHRLGRIIGTELRPPDRRPLMNRSFSARACRLSERRVALLRNFGMWAVGAGTRGEHRERQRQLERYIRGDPPPPADLAGPRERRSTAEIFYWRFWMQNMLDRLAYRDWDLLTASGLREPLSAHYGAVNRRLVDLLGADAVPPLYTAEQRLSPVPAAAATDTAALSPAESRLCL
jgi:hypothetical protein